MNNQNVIQKNYRLKVCARFRSETRLITRQAESYSAASLAELFLGLLFAFFSTGAKNLPV